MSSINFNRNSWKDLSQTMLLQNKLDQSTLELVDLN